MADLGRPGNKVLIRWGGSLLALIAFILLFLKAGYIYVINDDWGLYDVLSGAYLGYPDPHVSFMECPVSVFISVLYVMIPGLPWYGIFLESCLLVTALLLCRDEPVMFTVWLSMAAAVIMRPQYTTVSGMLMATAVFLLLKKDRGLEDVVKAVALVVLGEWIRPEMLLLFGAFIVPVWLLSMALGKDRAWEFKRLLFPGLVISGCIALTLIVSALFYNDPAWREFRKIDRMRVAMADYYGYPDYGQHEAELQAAGVDRWHLELISSGTMYAGRDLDSGQWAVIRDAAKSDSRGRSPLADRLSRMPGEFLKLFSDRNIRPYTFAAILISIFALLSGSYREVIVCAVSFVVPYFVLAFRGRVLDRVQMPLLSMYICGVAASLFYGGFIEKSRRFRITACVFAVMMLVPSFQSYAAVRSVRQETAEKLETWAGIRDYCAKNPDSLYLLTAGSYTLYYYQEDVFKGLPYGSENFIYLGSGHMMNPNTTKKLGDLGYGDILSDSLDPENDIYYIFEEGACDPASSLFTYLKAAPEKRDTFTSGSHSFEVYSLRAG